MEIVWTVAIIGWLICGVAGAAMLARSEKRQTGFLLGFFLGPIGLVIAWTMRDSQKQREFLEAVGSSSPGLGTIAGRKERECPYCAERILIKATLCKHCGSTISDADEFYVDTDEAMDVPLVDYSVKKHPPLKKEVFIRKEAIPLIKFLLQLLVGVFVLLAFVRLFTK